MRTEKEVKEEIEKLEEAKRLYELRGGGGVSTPYPYNDLIQVLQWVLNKD